MKIKRYDLMEDCTMEEQGRGEYVEYDAMLELISAFMIRNSFATGHGNFVEDLLAEFQAQLDERGLRR